MLERVTTSDATPVPPASTRSAAFFDLDKTIIARSSTLAFSRQFYDSGLITRRSVLRSASRAAQNSSGTTTSG